jgi:hypothetical protein
LTYDISKPESRVDRPDQSHTNENSEARLALVPDPAEKTYNSEAGLTVHRGLLSILRD